jgi:hypothetical protein
LSGYNLPQVLIDRPCVHAAVFQEFRGGRQDEDFLFTRPPGLSFLEFLGDQFHVGLGLVIGGIDLQGLDEMAQSRLQSLLLVRLDAKAQFPGSWSRKSAPSPSCQESGGGRNDEDPSFHDFWQKTIVT